MSIDMHIQLRTSLSAPQVRAALVGDPGLAGLDLVEDPQGMEVAGNAICVIVKPWQEDDHELIDNGFDTATVRCKTIPGRGEAGWDAERRVVAALLRLGQVVYVNPYGFTPEHLAEFGYTPPRLVIGIPDRRW